MSTDEVWSVDIGDEGWQLNHESGRTWGLNKNYGHPEDLAKFLNADHRKAAQADALAAALTNISDEIMAGGGDPITLRIMAREAQVLLASYASNPAEAASRAEWHERFPDLAVVIAAATALRFTIVGGESHGEHRITFVNESELAKLLTEVLECHNNHTALAAGWCSDGQHVVENEAEYCVCGLIRVTQPNLDNVDASEKLAAARDRAIEALREARIWIARGEARMSEQNETAPWQLDGEMKRLWDWRDSSDCWNIADLEMDRQAVCDYLNELEQSLAHERRQREAAELENFKLVTSIGEIESARLDAERQREAAEAERDRRIVANRKNQAEWETLFEESIEVGRKYNALKTYTAKLLALAEEQRRALVYVRNWGNSGMKHYVQLVLKASDLDALLAEAKELGIDATAPAMAPETGNAPDSEIAYNNDK